MRNSVGKWLTSALTNRDQEVYLYKLYLFAFSQPPQQQPPQSFAPQGWGNAYQQYQNQNPSDPSKYANLILLLT